ncbi:hypothetical protein WJX74_002593 [Apatococcus lobatus]|uniref:Uncharacterized protein n=1 Tax=Apatococcus lobatus TaxID=904363 RepID=A0AAW1RFW6_9CHLO
MDEKSSSLRVAAERQMRRPAPTPEQPQAKRQRTDLPDHAEIGRYAYQAVNLLEQGTLGLLVTCDMKREKTATAEVDGLLQELAKDSSITGTPAFAGSLEEADGHQQSSVAANLASGPTTLLRAKVDCRGLALLLWPAAAAQQLRNQLPNIPAAAATATANTNQHQEASAPAGTTSMSVAQAPAAGADASDAGATATVLKPSSKQRSSDSTNDPAAQGQLSDKSSIIPVPAAAASAPASAPASMPGGPAAPALEPSPLAQRNSAPEDEARVHGAVAQAKHAGSAEQQQPSAAATTAACEPPAPSAQVIATEPSALPSVTGESASAANINPDAQHSPSAGEIAMLGLPVKLVQQLLNGVEGGQFSRPKSCQRVVPLSWTCAWTAEAMRYTARRVTAAFLAGSAGQLPHNLAFAVQCKMRGPENQAGNKGTAGAGAGVESRSLCIPLLAAAMEDAFRAAEVTVQVNLRDPKVVLFAEAIPSSSRLFCGMAMVPHLMLDTVTSRGPILRHLSRKG